MNARGSGPSLWVEAELRMKDRIKANGFEPRPLRERTFSSILPKECLRDSAFCSCGTWWVLLYRMGALQLFFRFSRRRLHRNPGYLVRERLLSNAGDQKHAGSPTHRGQRRPLL